MSSFELTGITVADVDEDVKAAIRVNIARVMDGVLPSDVTITSITPTTGNRARRTRRRLNGGAGVKVTYEVITTAAKVMNAASAVGHTESETNVISHITQQVRAALLSDVWVDELRGAGPAALNAIAVAR